MKAQELLNSPDGNGLSGLINAINNDPNSFSGISSIKLNKHQINDRNNMIKLLKFVSPNNIILDNNGAAVDDLSHLITDSDDNSWLGALPDIIQMDLIQKIKNKSKYTILINFFTYADAIKDVTRNAIMSQIEWDKIEDDKIQLMDWPYILERESLVFKRLSNGFSVKFEIFSL